MHWILKAILLITLVSVLFVVLDERPVRVIVMDTISRLIFMTFPDPVQHPHEWILKLRSFPRYRPSVVSDHIKDIKINLTEFQNDIRIYYPKKPPPPTGYSLFVWIHGGGYCFGSYEDNGDFLLEISEKWGHLIMSIGYRLAPEYPFPTGVNDVYNTLLWIVKNVEEFKVDGKKIIVGGESAGAIFSSVMGLRMREEKQLKIAGMYLVSGSPLCNRSAAGSSPYASGYFFGATMANVFTASYFNNSKDWYHPYASFLKVPSLKGLPPALVHVTELDLHAEPSIALAEKLIMENGQNGAKYRIFPGLPHGGLVSLRFLYLEESNEAVKDLVNWMDNILSQKTDVPKINTKVELKK